MKDKNGTVWKIKVSTMRPTDVVPNTREFFVLADPDGLTAITKLKKQLAVWKQTFIALKSIEQVLDIDIL